MSNTNDSIPRFKRDGANVIDTVKNLRIVAGFNHKLQASDTCALLNESPEYVTGYDWEDVK